MRAVLLSILLMLLAVPAFAQWSKTPSKNFKIESSFQSSSEDVSNEIAVLLAYQESDRADDCAIARNQLHPSFRGFYEDFLSLSEEEFSRLEPLMERVIKFTNRVATYHKNRHKRPRPYQVDKRIKPCIAAPGGEKSFPSSHAATGMSSACVLAHIFSEESEELLSYGKYLGDLRLIGGVHFPSDVLAGQELGTEICNFLLQDSDFLEDLKASLAP